MPIPYPKPHPPYPAPGHTAIDRLMSAPPVQRQLHYHKALQHAKDTGLVETKSFKSLLKALSDHSPAEFQAIQLASGNPRLLVNPQSGLAADRQTAAGFYFRLPPPPEQNEKHDQKDTMAAELIELYWMALLRDVHFEKFTGPDSGELIDKAVTELSKLNLYAQRGSDRAPVFEHRPITRQNLFRGGDWWVPNDGTAPQHLGPYISQFLYLDIPDGAFIFDQRLRRSNETDEDPIRGQKPHLIEWQKWLDAQNGDRVGKPARPYDGRCDTEDGTPDPLKDKYVRYIQNMADLARYVHLDKLYQAYLDACFILLGAKAKPGKGNPYGKAPCGMGRGSTVATADSEFPKEEGFGTFGDPHILALVCEVSTRALKAVWYQKWFVHLRARPEAIGGVVHRALSGDATLDPQSARDILGSALPILEKSDAVAAVYAANVGTHLLPMCFPEGSPTHPAYGAGHACVAGACVTVLKAFFDDTQKLSELEDFCGKPLKPKVPNTAGTALEDYTGDHHEDLTVGGELDKLASNIAIGRNMAGVHWRTDYTQSVLLGQRVAISMLYHQRRDYHERPWCFHFTTFAGHQVEIDQYGVRFQKHGDTTFTEILDSDDDLSPEYEAHRLERIS